MNIYEWPHIKIAMDQLSDRYIFVAQQNPPAVVWSSDFGVPIYLDLKISPKYKHIAYRMGPPSDSVNRWFKKVAEKTMVYGRYNELVHGGYFMVYKPT